MQQGVFISLEGVDGSGKTTAIGFIKDYLISLGYDVLCTREPGGTLVGEEIRSMVLGGDTSSPMVDLLGMYMSRAELISRVIKPALAKGTIVIVDRFSDSSIAFQGYGQGLLKEAMVLDNLVVGNANKPTYTLFLDIPYEVSKERSLARASATSATLDAFECRDDEFFKAVFNGYKQLFLDNPDRMIRIDASISIEATRAQVKRWIDYEFVVKHPNKKEEM